MSMRDLISGEAELDDEENDDSFDEDTGEVRGRGENGTNGHMDDSSEEEDDDDDEEAARAVCLDNLHWPMSFGNGITNNYYRSGKASL